MTHWDVDIGKSIGQAMYAFCARHQKSACVTCSGPQQAKKQGLETKAVHRTKELMKLRWHRCAASGVDERRQYMANLVSHLQASAEIVLSIGCFLWSRSRETGNE